MYKNRLQEYTQKASLTLPVYRTVSEGYPHDPKFRSTVLVDGKEYTTQDTFPHRKEAEQGVAKLALTSILENIKEEEFSLIPEDTLFSKSILNEYTTKSQVEKPIYNTVRHERPLPVFFSSVVFGGVTFTGDVARNKKEAEQLAARVAIESLLENPESKIVISKIVKSKRKLHVGLHKFDSQDAQHNNMQLVKNDTSNEATVVSNATTKTVITDAGSSVLQPSHHEFTKLKPEKLSSGINLPITFVNPMLGQLSDVLPSGRKRRKNKKKANKKMRKESQLPVDTVPLNQVASYPVSS